MALYAISAVYFAGVMVRLMLTLTPVVCMLSAVAFSSVFEHYLGDDNKRQSPPAEDSGDEDDRKNAGNLYDKVAKMRSDLGWTFFNVQQLLLTLSLVSCRRVKCANTYRSKTRPRRAWGPTSSPSSPC